MTMATQQHLHDPASGTVGDCWRAGIASILGVPITTVPHFVRDYPNHPGDTTARWFDETCRWLTEHHQATILYYATPDATRAENRTETSAYPHILIDGISPRGVPHVIVADAHTGEPLHDPHPSRDGLTTITGAFVIVR